VLYPPETCIAEKFHTIVVRGILNSRMKDYFDIWALSQKFEFDGIILAKAIGATFVRRRTDMPEDVPVGLTEEFSLDTSKQTQWHAFVRRTPLRAVENDLATVVSTLQDFLARPLMAAASGKAFKQKWSRGGPWQ